jgi:hypothetical protein
VGDALVAKSNFRGIDAEKYRRMISYENAKKLFGKNTP